MYWYIIILVIIGAVSFVGTVHAVQKHADTQKKVQVKPMKRLSSEDIRSQLKILSMKSIPKDIEIRGAMCYDVAMPPERVEYVCPKDGSKTIYTTEMVEFIEYQLPAIRSLAETMPSVSVTVDESEFCKKCSPNIKIPQVSMTIHFSDRTHTVKGISLRDIKIMYAFLSGNDRYKDEYDAETALQDLIPRLEQLLGVTIKK